MNQIIFREYDIRGVVGEDITEPDVIRIGKAFGTYLLDRGMSRVVVGRDCRLSSATYRDLLIKGLIGVGCDVVDIGVCPTPVLYFAIRLLQGDGGVMITASHNPSTYNGFKLCCGYETLCGESIKTIGRIAERGMFTKGTGTLTTFYEIADDVYKKFIKENISIARPLRVGIDAGNATGGVVAVPLLRELGCDVSALYCDMDGCFPHHHPDPAVVENMEDLSRLVREKGLDVGIGYDGDADRIGVVDENGTMVYADHLMLIFARDILLRQQDAAFIFDVKCSMNLYNDIRQRGGRPVMWRTGHSPIKKKMGEVNAALGGDLSGHIFFADRYFGYDDAIYASCRLLEILASSGKKLSGLISDTPKTFVTPEIRIPCPEWKKFQVVDAAKAYFAKSYDIIDVEGVRVLFEDGWALVRASNTEPVLGLRFEATTHERLMEVRRYVESVLKNLGVG